MFCFDTDVLGRMNRQTQWTSSIFKTRILGSGAEQAVTQELSRPCHRPVPVVSLLFLYRYVTQRKRPECSKFFHCFSFFSLIRLFKIHIHTCKYYIHRIYIFLSQYILHQSFVVYSRFERVNSKVSDTFYPKLSKKNQSAPHLKNHFTNFQIHPKHLLSLPKNVSNPKKHKMETIRKEES